MHVQQFVFWCVVHDQNWASFNTHIFHWQSLPIMGLIYLGNLDFVGPLNLIIWWPICLDYDWTCFQVVGVGVVLDHNNEWEKTYAFLDRVFSKFGILVEIFTHQCEEFHEKSKKLSEETLNKSLYNFTRPCWGEWCKWWNQVYVSMGSKTMILFGCVVHFNTISVSRVVCVFDKDGCRHWHRNAWHACFWSGICPSWMTKHLEKQNAHSN